MTSEAQDLLRWIQTCLAFAAFFSTAFPLLYLFSPWYKTKLGRVLMLQAVAFALAIDLTLIFQFWTPSNIYVILWTNVVVFTLIAIATGLLTWGMWRINHNKWVIRRKHKMRTRKKEKIDA